MTKKTTLGELTPVQGLPLYLGLADKEKVAVDLIDAKACAYAWGRLDEGHPPVVSLTEGQTATNSDTAWAFGSLYARMELELNDPRHPRSVGFGHQTAWEIFARTGCRSGNLPQRLS